MLPETDLFVLGPAHVLFTFPERVVYVFGNALSMFCLGQAELIQNPNKTLTCFVLTLYIYIYDYMWVACSWPGCRIDVNCQLQNMAIVVEHQIVFIGYVNM